ncbi:MAG: hypothetical protein B7Y44_08485 [Sphingomonadales bacterium 28-55-16]|nr:MAG: hypothetical protein B7Y44_08485 [Sphingomonadales bacterium 28-55-16]
MIICGALYCLLSGCGDNLASFPSGGDDAGAGLDSRAVQAGILPDREKKDLAGRYETRGDLGVDKLCVVKKSSDSFNIGFLSISGADSKCEGTGTATVDGESVEIALKGQGDCKFTARYDGFELRFPAVIDSVCARYCSDRASFSATHYFMIAPGNAAARDTLGRDIERLCT